jgi:hypothetical protein
MGNMNGYKHRLSRLEAAERPRQAWEDAEAIKQRLLARLVELHGGEDALATLPEQTPEEHEAAYREVTQFLRERVNEGGRSIWHTMP